MFGVFVCVTEILFFSLQGRWGCRNPVVVTEVQMGFSFAFFFFFMSEMRHETFLHCISSVQELNLEKRLQTHTEKASIPVEQGQLECRRKLGS